MRYIIILSFCFLVFSCKKETEVQPTEVLSEAAVFTGVTIDNILIDSTSIRAISVTDSSIIYGGSNGHYGYFKTTSNLNESGKIIITEKNKGVVDFLGKQPSFRSVAITKDAYFLLSIENPALLYRYDLYTNQMKLVYTEDRENIFYDSLTFINDQEGIAIGDPVDGCLSIIKTLDGGKTWNKLDCSILPKTLKGEAAFAASDTNIKSIDDNLWVIGGGGASRVYKSSNKGISWEVYNTPLIQGEATQGGYSIDFYDNLNGIIYGGDYTKPTNNQNNIAITNDGGKSWELIAQSNNDGYKSCVQYVPNRNGRDIVAVGFTGISYSNDGGNNWQSLSEEPFFSIRFITENIALASGKNKISFLYFK